MAYVITALAALVVGFGIGYIVAWRNPPKSLIQKLQNKVS